MLHYKRQVHVGTSLCRLIDFCRCFIYLWFTSYSSSHSLTHTRTHVPPPFIFLYETLPPLRSLFFFLFCCCCCCCCCCDVLIYFYFTSLQFRDVGQAKRWLCKKPRFWVCVSRAVRFSCPSQFSYRCLRQWRFAATFTGSTMIYFASFSALVSPVTTLTCFWETMWTAVSSRWRQFACF